MTKIKKPLYKFNKAGSLYMDCSSIKKFILMPYWNLIDSSRTRVDDIMYPLIQDEKSIHSPQYAVIGRYMALAKNSASTFFIDTQGPHILYVTEVPKEVDKTSYRFENALWVTYWEDDESGYLFQILPR